MAIKNKASVVSLTTTATAVLTSLANESFVVAKVLACNTSTTTARLVTLHHSPTGGAAGTGNIILYQYAIAAKETKILPISALFVSNGGIVYALQDVGTDVNLDINYSQTEQQP